MCTEIEMSYQTISQVIFVKIISDESVNLEKCLLIV